MNAKQRIKFERRCNAAKATFWIAVSAGYVAIAAKFAVVAHDVDMGRVWSSNPHVAAWAGYSFTVAFCATAIITTAHAVELIRKGR